MASLVSPGLSITVTDDSAYLPTAAGTVPLVVFATQQNKLFNGVIGSGTIAANAGQLQAVTSQRDLITAFGYPLFMQTASGTPINGHECSEYGLMAAYSALGVSNRSFLIRADIDLAAIMGSTARPIDNPADGTYWLDTTESTWGIYEWDASIQSFTNHIPTLITSLNDVTLNGSVYYPNTILGAIGSYAVVMVTTFNRLFYKRSDNIWTLVGTDQWKLAHPAVKGTEVITTSVFSISDIITINTIPLTLVSQTLGSLISLINNAAIPGVTAANVGNSLAIYATSLAKSNGSVVDGKVTLANTTGIPLTTAGITAGTYFAPDTTVSDYITVPAYATFPTTTLYNGNVWIKLGSIGGGANLSVKKFSTATNAWAPIAVPMYISTLAAIETLDPSGGGGNILAGSLISVSGRHQSIVESGITSKIQYRIAQGKTNAVGNPIASNAVVVVSNEFTIDYSTLNSPILTTATVTIGSTAPSAIVTSILGLNIPEISASYNSSTLVITVTHTLGGIVTLTNKTGTPLTTAGFNSSCANVQYTASTGAMAFSNFTELSYITAISQPYIAPADGTYWYYNSPLDVDIMINDTTGWKGYQNVSADTRGFNLAITDPNGVIFSAGAPTTQSDSTQLEPGDLWIDTLDLENYPALYRYSSTDKWVAIDNTDVITQNGIVFADARWDGAGTADPVADAKPTTISLLTSNGTDLDCPDHRLYPRGTLLFNTRRSGFNIKKYVAEYFTDAAYPDASLPAISGTWLSASGLRNDGSLNAGHHAQRDVVIKALRGAIDGSTTVREESFAFNLIACPGYPEVISNMVALNNDRKNTAFVVGDTPMTLSSDIITLTNWSNNTDGTGLSTADPYLGVYYPSALTNDIQGNTIVVPASHVMLRTMIRNDNVSYPWFAPAGMRRGLVDNAVDIGHIDVTSGHFIRNGVNQGLRDALYSMNINPLTILPGAGLVVWGQKTRNPFSSAMDRVNVARLVNYIRTILAHAGNAFLFEPNDEQTRKEFKALISGVFNDLIAKRGIYDFLVVCDESNNTSDRIARNELYCDVAIEPMKAVEFIYIPIRLKNPGAIKAG